MLTFMFGVLGSMMFWVAYGIISLFIGTFFLKKIAPITHEYVTTGKRDLFLSNVGVLFILITCYILWPFVVLGFIVKILFNFIFKTLMWNTFCYCIKFADKSIPEISIKMGKKEE